MTPPNPSILTDEDSGDEEEGGILDNLSGPQLASTAELVFSNNSRIGEFINDHKKTNETIILDKKKKRKILAEKSARRSKPGA